MTKRKQLNKAQIIGEYALTLFLVVGVLTAMTIYIRRVLQARIFDTRRYMINTVKSAPHVGKLRLEYEPYYVDTKSSTGHYQKEEVNLLGGGDTGIFRKDFEDVTNVRTSSEQLPPANGD